MSSCHIVIINKEFGRYTLSMGHAVTTSGRVIVKSASSRNGFDNAKKIAQAVKYSCPAKSLRRIGKFDHTGEYTLVTLAVQ